MVDPQLTVQPTQSLAVFQAANALYLRVFGYTAADHSLNPKLLSAIVGNGGAAVAATTPAGELIGFAYGFVGFDGGAPYLYSQAAFIDPEYQGLGIGRLLKQEQATIATRAGLTSMRWAFDPILSRNAHFNLNVLGAVGVRFAPHYYDEPDSDRLIVEWGLDATEPSHPDAAAATPAAAIAPADWGHALPADAAGVIAVPIPSASPKLLDPALVATLRVSVADTFTALFARGYTAQSCVRVDDATSTYLFAPHLAAPHLAAPHLASPVHVAPVHVAPGVPGEGLGSR
ncbi:putative GNAT superfamily acetyltransferase [Glaciihabitans tibetensis]|uniref:Putative GNAT superfamily acetyltransferase n=1 Tax=Glaciihabitans tibetensis TaxID=1266600 RepID=A0A2T0VA49_9MICO|nr:GNAT family N-acetyltransferase [Glaciihabitans tibetensis]PRY67069.1 putative GNAT superfamily acetyltransferase [Glaciihabitans tibetensis]